MQIEFRSFGVYSHGLDMDRYYCKRMSSLVETIGSPRIKYRFLVPFRQVERDDLFFREQPSCLVRIYRRTCCYVILNPHFLRMAEGVKYLNFLLIRNLSSCAIVT